MMHPLKKRSTQAQKDACVEAIASGRMSQYAASKWFGIPIHLIRQLCGTNKTINKPVLNNDHENELAERICRLADVGYPFTSKTAELCFYKYCMENNIKHCFSDIKSRKAARRWLGGFLSRHADVSKKISQRMNPAQAKKLSRFDVVDYFSKLGTILVNNQLSAHPEKIYNVVEKTFRLMLHKDPSVNAKKGPINVHPAAKGRMGKSMTIVACGSATGSVIPPLIILQNGRFKRSQLTDSLPYGSIIEYTKTASMTNITFTKWVEHFAKFKISGRCLLIFDGVNAHLDYKIVDDAEKHDIELLCLPSNTTHELQPMYKSCFGPFEEFWSRELFLSSDYNNIKYITRAKFGETFSLVWDRSMTQQNICSGFKATGVYPFNPNVISEQACVPSGAKLERANPTTENEEPETVPNISHQNKNNQLPFNPTSRAKRKRCSKRRNKESSSSDDEYFSSDFSDQEMNRSFKDKMPTPLKTHKSNQQINPIQSPVIHLRKNVFGNQEKKTQETDNTESVASKKGLAKKNPKTKKVADKNGEWYCFVCEEGEIKDMRACFLCGKFVHEDCVGLTKDDKEKFICPLCSL